MIDLRNYRNIQTNMFVRLDVPGYQVLTFSDYHRSLTLNGTSYVGLGQLLSISDTSSNLRAAPADITVAISGIPSGRIAEFLNYKIKGSAISILRAFSDSQTGELLNITGNPVGKFQGIVSNYEITDDLDIGADTGSVTINISATSVVELLNNKISGRRTNPTDQLKLYPNDQSMNRVPSLAKSNFNFGAPK